MAFTESQEYKLEIIPPHNVIQCRRADIVQKDGVEVGRSYHRSAYCPGDDVSEAPQQVKDVAAALWTEELITSYQESISQSSLPGGE